MRVWTLRLLAVVVTLFLGLFAPVSPGFAATIDVTGTPGQDGAPGDGSGGAANDGQPGTAGSLTSAIANDPAGNTATAHGAVGGKGGAGAFGSPPPENGGNGGAGGAGSVAIAVAGSAALGDQTATANGGGGGAGGAAGGSDGGPVGAPGNGGAGGSAQATASSANSVATATATGGSGGAAGGPGGTGGVGGSASAAVTGEDFLTARSFGGAGGSAPGGFGGAGGSATGSATSNFAGLSSQSVTATGGRGGDGGLGGGRGGDASIVDGISENGVPDDSALQSANGGEGGNGPGSRGGDALSTITLHTHDATLIGSGIISASFGGAAPTGTGGNGRSGAVLDDTGSKSVSVYAGASGGNGLVGGTSSLDLVRGTSSTGAPVTVKGEVRGGRGDQLGAEAHVVDAVSGSTSGSLTLIQDATGGNSKAQAGDASSVLHGASSSQSLSVRTTTFAGSILNDTFFIQSASGADGLAESDATNDAGSADAQATAYAGSGVGISIYGNGGGDGDAIARATTTGDAHLASSVATARAGNGMNYHVPGVDLSPGAGHARAESNALGESAVTAKAYGYGGPGLSVNPANVMPGGAGQADATAVGQHQFVDALAAAYGGHGSYGSLSDNSGPMGAARATATATGFSWAQALAQTEGGGTSIGHAIVIRPGYEQVEAGTTTLGRQTHSNSRAARQAVLSRTDAGALMDQSGNGAVAVGDPDSSVVSTWTSGNPNVEGSLAEGHLIGVGLLAAESSGAEVQSYARFTLEGPLNVGHVVVGFLDPEILGIGFNALHVEIDTNDQVFFTKDFTNPSDALASLDDFLVFVPSSAFAPGEAASLTVSLTASLGGTGNAVRSDFAVFAVPEPACAVLALAALAALARLGTSDSKESWTQQWLLRR